MDDMIYLKQDRLDIYYSSGTSEDGTIYHRPCLTVARNNYKDMTIENKFYDDEAVALYKKLTDNNDNVDDSLRKRQLKDLGNWLADL